MNLSQRITNPQTRRFFPWLALALLIFIFAAIADEVVEQEPFAFDTVILLSLRSASDSSVLIGPLWLPEAARDITSLGSTVVLGIVLFSVAVYLFLARKPRDAWWAIAAVSSGVVLNNVLKLSIGRPRPDIVIPAAKVFSSSFPSGHATLSAITYLTLGALLARDQPPHMRIYFLTIAAILTFLVGITRVYLGVHYPSDVVAGWCAGSGWALFCWLIARNPKFDARHEPPR